MCVSSILATPVSEVVICPQLSSPDGGWVNISIDSDSQILSGSIAIYGCRDGRHLSIRECQDNGTWSGDEPSCDSENFYLCQFGFVISYFTKFFFSLGE